MDLTYSLDYYAHLNITQHFEYFHQDNFHLMYKHLYEFYTLDAEIYL